MPWIVRMMDARPPMYLHGVRGALFLSWVTNPQFALVFDTEERANKWMPILTDMAGVELCIEHEHRRRIFEGGESNGI